jgi:hypothetical protein
MVRHFNMTSTPLLVVVIGILIVLILGLVAWYVWDTSRSSSVPSAHSPSVEEDTPAPAPSDSVPSPSSETPSPDDDPAPVPSLLPSVASSPTETYEWRSDSWGNCQLSGHSCNRYRSVTCADSQGRVVPNSQCPGWMPPVRESCNYPERSVCYAGKWVADGDFEPCKLHNIVIDGQRVTCGAGAGSQTRKVKCEGPGACDPLSPDLTNLQFRSCDIPC